MKKSMLFLFLFVAVFMVLSPKMVSADDVSTIIDESALTSKGLDAF